MNPSGFPVIPESITVHLGAPATNAPHVTVPFADYIANVASSEIYPTWPESAIRANVYAQISYALNRVYTEYYRSRGYDFDITNSTTVDQSFVNGRDIFENVQQIVNDIFNDYIRRRGFVEPLFAQYCNGTTVTCNGLSQWGSVDLANAGYTPYRILQNYYGNNIDIIQNAPIAGVTPSAPAVPLLWTAQGARCASSRSASTASPTTTPASPRSPTPTAFSALRPTRRCGPSSAPST